MEPMKAAFALINELLDGTTALHEAAHAVISARLDMPTFTSTDIIRRTEGPDVLEGGVTLGVTTNPWPEVVTKGFVWKRAIVDVAPSALSKRFDYVEDGIEGDGRSLVRVARHLGKLDLAEFDSLCDCAASLVNELFDDPCVLRAIGDTAMALLKKQQLSADEVRAILKATENDTCKIRPLSSELERLINLPELTLYTKEGDYRGEVNTQ